MTRSLRLNRTLVKRCTTTKKRATQKWVTFHSKSLPRYTRDGHVTFFDQFGVKRKAKQENFKDVTTPGGRFHKFYTYKVKV